MADHAGAEDVGHNPLGQTLLGLHGAVEEPGKDFVEGDISIVRVQEVLGSLRRLGDEFVSLADSSDLADRRREIRPTPLAPMASTGRSIRMC